MHETIEGSACGALGRENDFEEALWELDGIIDELGEE